MSPLMQRTSLTKETITEQTMAQVVRALGMHSDCTGFIEVRTVNPAKQWFIEFPQYDDWGTDLTELTDLANTLNGKQNVYIGRNIRSREDGSANGIDFANAVSFDFDPIRPKDLPATEAEVAEAVSTVTRLQKLVGGGSVVMTGNGAQLWVPISDDLPFDIRGRRKWWALACRRFEDDCVSKLDYDREKLRHDPQWDIPRVVKLAGTKSVKGVPTSDRPHRQSYFVNFSSVGISSEKILAHSVDTEEGSLDAINQKDVPVGVPERFWRILESGRDTKMMESWNGTRKDIADPSGSGQDCALAHRLKYYGFTPEEAISIMSQAPGGKKRYTFQYARHTVENIYGKAR